MPSVAELFGSDDDNQVNNSAKSSALESMQSTATAEPSDTADDELAKLRVQLAAEQQRASDLKTAKDTIEKRHENYKKTKQKEMQKLKENASTLETEDYRRAVEERDAAMARAEAALRLTSTTEASATAVVKLHSMNIYKEVLKRCHDAVDAQIKIITHKFTNRDTLVSFDYHDQNGSWARVTDKTMVDALRDLHSGRSAKACYSFNGNSYEAVFKLSGGKKRAVDADDTICIEQTNLATGVVRDIRLVSGKRTYADIALEHLFSACMEIDLPESFLTTMLANHRFEMGDQSEEINLSIASLAQKLSDLTDRKFVYVKPTAVKPTHPFTPQTCHSENGMEFCSELWCKPHGIHNWMRLASDRGYYRARIFCHGSSNYKALRADAYGFDMKFASGQQFGNGVYGGLSWHATQSYNDTSTYPQGTFVIGLHLIIPSNGWQHRFQRGGGSNMGAYTKMYDDNVGKLYKTINFNSPISELDNAVVIHDVQMAMPLGWARAFDYKKGWLMQHERQ